MVKSLLEWMILYPPSHIQALLYIYLPLSTGEHEELRFYTRFHGSRRHECR
jgi:hypothetical protein